jgi:hypothetical protein
MAERGEDDVALDVMMTRMADHLDALAAKVFELEETLSTAIDQQDQPDQDGRTITKLQSLDFLRQSLEDLALLTCFLSKNVSEAQATRVNATTLTHGLKLDVTKRLVLPSSISSSPRPPDATGDIDLF